MAGEDEAAREPGAEGTGAAENSDLHAPILVLSSRPPYRDRVPEMWFDVRWPDGARDRLYSPSLVVREHLGVGQQYPVADFLARSRTVLGIASDRVQARYGHPCSRSAATLAHIEAAAATQDATGTVLVEAFDPPR